MPKQKSEYRRLLEQISILTGSKILTCHIWVMELLMTGLPGVENREDAAREIINMLGA